MHICYSLRQGLNFVIIADYTYDASIGIARFINLGNNVNYILSGFNINYYILYIIYNFQLCARKLN